MTRGDAAPGSAVRGALVAYALTAGLCLVVVLSLFVRARNLRAHDAMVDAASERAREFAKAITRRGAARPLDELRGRPGLLEAYVVNESVVTSQKYPFLKSLRVALHSEKRRSGKPLADKEVFDIIVAGGRRIAPDVGPPALVSLEHWVEFAKASPAGKAVQGHKAEWSSLLDRERAALNENFARELPLEFRKLLKDYYEALAK